MKWHRNRVFRSVRASFTLALSQRERGLITLVFIPPRAYALGYTHAAPLALKQIYRKPLLDTGFNAAFYPIQSTGALPISPLLFLIC